MTDWLGTFLAICARSEIGERLFKAEPAWVWSRDGASLAWANPAGARLLGLSSLDALMALGLPEKQNLRRDIANVARTLGQGVTLARLRFYRGARTVPLACRCERLRIGDGRTLVLVTGLEPVGGKRPDSAADFAAFMQANEGATFVLDADGNILAGHGEAGAPAGLSALAAAEGGSGHEILADGRSARFVTVSGSDGPRILLWTGPLGDHRHPAEPDAAASESEEDDAGTDAGGHGEAVEDRPSVVATVPEIAIAAGADADDSRGEVEPAEQQEPVSEMPEEAEEAGTAAAADQVADQAAGPEADRADDELQDQNLSEQARILRSALRGSSGSEAKSEPSDSAWPHALADLPRKPVRFLWQTDADDRFLFVSPGLEQMVGRSSHIVGERWTDIASRMRLDPVGRITHALAARDTWSGYTAWWPAEDYGARIPAELTALPVFAMDQSFQGYRGFGVLKPAEALSEDAFDRRFPGIPDRLPEPPPPRAPAVPRAPSVRPVGGAHPDEAGSGPAGNVVPIRNDIDQLPDFARLSPQERSAFDEIGSALRTHHESGRTAIDARHEPLETSGGAPAADDDNAPPPADEAIAGAASGEVPVPPDAAPDDDSAFSTDAQDPAFLASLPDDDDDYPADIDDVYPDDFEDLLEAKDGDEDDDGTLDEAEDHADDTAQAEDLIAPEPANDDQLREPASATDEAAPAAGLPGEAQRRIEELSAILDTATDGVVIVDHAGLIQSLNASAEALFGQEEDALAGSPFSALFGEDSRQAALDYLDGLRDNGVASVLNEGREVAARSGEGLIPLFMTMGHISGQGEDARFCAVLRDISQWKRTEAELIAGRKSAEKASEQKSDFLARVSHEIRTPLNAIIGFAEVMIEERFGPVENDRYREYLRDIRTSGEHVVSLVNDLLDISKIEAGKLDLTFAAVPLNDLVRECVALMQPQANRAQVIVRSSLASDLPAIVADPRTMRQVVLNLVSNSVKFTGSGGQVIVSTTLADTGEAILRVRDTGSGMSEDDLARALEPFRQLSTSRIGDDNGTGLGLPLTKALVEANRAEFSISSARGEGTIVQVTFPATRVLSE